MNSFQQITFLAYRWFRWPRSIEYEKLITLYNKSKEEIEKELNIVNIIKSSQYAQNKLNQEQIQTFNQRL